MLHPYLLTAKAMIPLHNSNSIPFFETRIPGNIPFHTISPILHVESNLKHWTQYVYVYVCVCVYVYVYFTQSSHL